MVEKEIWKWILDSFSDEGIASIADSFGIKIAGFRQLNSQQKNFKMIRPRIIKAALHQRHAQKLTDFFNSIDEDQTEIESVRKKNTEELLQLVEEEIQPSMLLGILLSSDEKENLVKAEKIYTQLKDQEKLDLLERQADEMESNVDNDDETENKTLANLQEEFKAAKQIIEKLDKRIKKFEQKMDELKSKDAMNQVALKNEKKRSKEEKNTLIQEINGLKGEIGNLKHQEKSTSSEKASLQKKLDNQTGTLKLKNEEISRLNALVLKLQSDLEKHENLKETTAHIEGNLDQVNQKVKVALFGDPKNSRIKNYHKFELTIIEGTEVLEEKTHIALDSSDQVWLLKYKIPRSTQKRVRSLLKGKQLKEFTTFIDLEDYMLKGTI